MKSFLLKAVYALLCIVLGTLVYQLGFMFIERMEYWRELAGYFDWPVFVDTAWRYIKTGELYLQNTALYGPGEPVYKFPPLFLSGVIFCLQHGIPEDSLRFWSSIVHVMLYFFTGAILLLRKEYRHAYVLYPLVALYLLSSETFFDNYLRLQLEIYVVLLVSLAMVFLMQQQYFSSGFCLGFAAGLKIYPAFFCLGLLTRRHYLSWVGVVAGLVATICLSLVVIPFNIHWDYLTRITPFMLSENISLTNENISLGRFLILLNVSEARAAIAGKACLLLAIAIFISGVVLATRKSLPNDDASSALRVANGFSVLVAGFVLGAPNVWWNYQLLLMVPIIVMMGTMSNRFYFSWFNTLAILVASIFIYAGSIGHLEAMAALNAKWLGESSLLSPLFLNSVYLRAAASVLIFIAAVRGYWRTLECPAIVAAP